MGEVSQQACASVIIPAHDEGAVIERCLEALDAFSRTRPLEVVVAANGCTDDTVARARRHRGVTVLDLPQPSKVAAINAGDAAASAFPRIYLDADIVISERALDAMIRVLDTDRPLAAAPRVRFVTAASTWPVRAFYRVFRRLPYVQDRLVGLGVYGMSRAGRSRFEEFPDILGDDLFAQRIFAPAERVVVEGTFDVQVPRTVRQLVKVRTRVARGNAQLARDLPSDAVHEEETPDFSATTGSTSRALLDLVLRRPALLPSALVYIAVTAVARQKARRRQPTAWERDTSTR